ncbi:unnamed protein product [Ectocarpus sp. 12 AP-2014]
MEKNGRLFQPASNAGSNTSTLPPGRVQLVQPSTAPEVDYGDAHTVDERGRR